MAEVDLGVLIRVVSTLGSLNAAMEHVGSPVPPEEGVPLMTRTQRLAIVARDALDEERRDLLVALLHPDFFEKSVNSMFTRASLATILGYLRGCIDELEWTQQRDANAKAYAEAKVRAERGVGFQPPTPR